MGTHVGSTTYRFVRASTPEDDACWDEVAETWKGLDIGLIPALFRGFDCAEASSARKGVRFDLSRNDVGRLMARSRGRCEVSGLPFSMAVIAGARKRPYIPSIDRIKAKEPYSFANCRLVCCAVNIAINDWGDGVFWTIVRSAASK